MKAERIPHVDGPPGIRLGPGWALFLDVDGTLLDIALRPDEVTVPPGLTIGLAKLAERLGGALALVSGRTIDNLDRLFAPLVLPAAGVHGAELRLAPGLPVAAAPAEPALTDALPVLRRLADAWPGVVVEDKGRAVAVHFRLAPAAEPAIVTTMTAIAAKGGGLEVLPGHMVRELRDGRHTKGTAVRTFMATSPFMGRRPLFLGDDVTDEDGFRAAEAAGGVALAVGHHPGLGRPAVFGRPADVRAWLAQAGLDGAGDGE
ncbi:MAG: trehalose-phosphatase [Alphaproteobacteria bacterium]